MRLSPVSALALLAAASSAFAASDVSDLTEGTFKAEVLAEDLALVEFFAPWCGHCKNLAPHYEEAATELKSRNIKLAKVDCTEAQSLCGEYGVSGYPTLKVFRNGVPTDYTGPRKADGIIKYMIKQSLPAVSVVTADNHDEFSKSDNVVLIAYGDDAHPVPQGFIDYANTARDSFLFGQYKDEALPTTLPQSVSLPAIILYKQFDEGYAVFPADEVASVDPAALAAFVKSNSLPLFDEISPENFGSYAELGLPIAYLFVQPEDTDAIKKLVDELRPIAEELKGKVSFVYIDAVKFVEHGKQLNLPGDSWPAFVIQDLAGQQKYPFSGIVNLKSVGDFARQVVKGDVAPSIKSEPVPAVQEKPVFHLVADAWEDVFGDAEKDIFAEFYAPWCGHCQRLAPIWETLAERYSSNSNVLIAQMDATANDIPPQAPFRVQGFPTLKFRPAGSSEFIDYTGDRSLDSLIEFIEANRKSEGEAPEAGFVEDEGDDLDEEDFEDVEDVEEDEVAGHEHDEL